LTYALVDNATLSAVQRIIGDISTKTDYSVDTDIVALENLIQAILFYDEILAIDDYIPKHREERVRSFPFIKFLKPEELNLNQIEATAEEKAKEIRPEIRGGEFVNEDFRKLLELLQTHIICTWDISSSVYHLTLKSLSDNWEDFSKFGNLAAGIFCELIDIKDVGGKTSSEVKLIDRFGKPIDKGYLVPDARWGNGGTSSGEASDAIKAFVASLVWLSNRSIYYSLVSKYLQADSFLYPIRQAYQQIYISETCNYGFDYAKRLVQNFSSTLNKDLFDIQHSGLAFATGFNYPVFSAWIAKEVKNPKAIIQTALEIKTNKEFVETRQQLREIRKLFDEAEIADANHAVSKIVKDIHKSSQNIRTKYGLQTRQGVPVTRLIQVYNTISAVTGLPELPEYDFKIQLPEFLRELKKPKGFNTIYRNLSNDLSTVWSLGEARDILGSAVVKEELSHAYNPKQEQPRYRNSHSTFKSPM